VRLENLFDELLDSYLKKNDPENKETACDDINIDKSKHTKHIPRKVKDYV